MTEETYKENFKSHARRFQTDAHSLADYIDFLVYVSPDTREFHLSEIERKLDRLRTTLEEMKLMK